MQFFSQNGNSSFHTAIAMLCIWQTFVADSDKHSKTKTMFSYMFREQIVNFLYCSLQRNTVIVCVFYGRRASISASLTSG